MTYLDKVGTLEVRCEVSATNEMCDEIDLKIFKVACTYEVFRDDHLTRTIYESNVKRKWKRGRLRRKFG